MKTYRDLIVWQKSMTFVTDIYECTSEFPNEEKLGLTSQLRRCAVSIPSNISEGYGRNSLKEYIRFLTISISSLFELQTQIEIAKNLSYLEVIVFDDLFEKSRELERMLSSLIRSLKKKI